MPAVRWTC